MTAVDELRARREEREARVTKADIRRSFGGAGARDRARSEAYEAGKAGRDIPFTGEDDELYDLYNQGQADAEAEREAKPGAKKAAGTGRVTSPRRRAPRVATKARRAISPRSVSAAVGGSPSALQLFGFAVLLAGLYLVLANAAKVAQVTGGALRALNWIIDPHATLGGTK